MFPDNGNREITAARFRGFVEDILDSLQFAAEAVTVQQVLDQVKEGQHISITRVSGEITIAYDQGSNVGTHSRYWALTPDSSIPSAAAFMANGAYQADVTVDAYSSAMYLHFWDEHSQLTTIMQTSSQFNGRNGFGATPSQLTVDGNPGYVYTSIMARNPAGQRTWRLEP